MRLPILLLGGAALAALPLPLRAAAAPPPAPPAAPAQFTKTIKKRFAVEPEGDLRLDNRYGDIDYEVWDRGSVEIEITVTAYTPTEAKAERVFERIDFDIAAAPRSVSAATELEAGPSTWSWGSRGSRFEIDYRVRAPRGWRLDIEHRYGDVRLPDLATDTEVDLRYGDLEAGDIAGVTTLKLGYGEAELGRLGDLEADLQYAEATVRRAGVARVRTRYSDARIGRVTKLRLDSRHGDVEIAAVGEFVNAGGYDDFRIDSAGSVSIDSRYTDVHIGYLADGAVLDLRYGEADIAATSARLKTLDLTGSYTDFAVRFDPAVTYRLEAAGNYTNFALPAALEVSRRESAGSSRSVAGHYGANPQASVLVANHYGSLRVE